MPEIKIEWINSPMGPRTVSLQLSDGAMSAVSMMREFVETKARMPLPIICEHHRDMPGASVQLNTYKDRLSIVVQFGPTWDHFKSKADLFLTHEIGHICVQALGIDQIRNIEKRALSNSINSAIMDVTEHPFIWRIHQKYGVPWSDMARRRLEIFEPQYKFEREKDFRNETYREAKVLADLQFDSPSDYLAEGSLRKSEPRKESFEQTPRHRTSASFRAGLFRA